MLSFVMPRPMTFSLPDAICLIPIPGLTPAALHEPWFTTRLVTLN